MSDIEDDCDESAQIGFSVDEILSTVLKTKNKLGRIRLPAGLLAKRTSSRAILEEKNESDDQICSTTTSTCQSNLPATTSTTSEYSNQHEIPHPIICSGQKNNLLEQIPIESRCASSKLAFSMKASTTSLPDVDSHHDVTQQKNSGKPHGEHLLHRDSEQQNSVTKVELKKSVIQTQIKPPQEQHRQERTTDGGLSSVDENGASISMSKVAIVSEKPSLHSQHKIVNEPVLTKHISPSEDKTSVDLNNFSNIVVNNKKYLKQKKIGEGGSSKVYLVVDLQDCECKAIKVVNLDNSDEAHSQTHRDEIRILQRLKSLPRIIKLYDFEETANEIRIVMEVGSIDLACIIRNARKSNTKLHWYTIKHYWHEMLLAVQLIHKEGIIHSDLKPANFLLVGSTLKLIDFGIASSIQNDETSVFKETQAGTYNYMSPESLTDVYQGPLGKFTSTESTVIKIGVKSDVWSLGCILYNMVYGKTPFQHITKFLPKITTISDPNHVINFPTLADTHLLSAIQSCLRFDPRDRPSIDSLLEHPYLTGCATA